MWITWNGRATLWVAAAAAASIEWTNRREHCCWLCLWFFRLSPAARPLYSADKKFRYGNSIQLAIFLINTQMFSDLIKWCTIITRRTIVRNENCCGMLQLQGISPSRRAHITRFRCQYDDDAEWKKIASEFLTETDRAHIKFNCDHQL